MPIIYQKIISRADLQQNKHIFYVFGDNVLRKGFGGQAAEMRGESNAIGIRVKYSPGMDADDFYNDNNYDNATRMIHQDIERIRAALELGKLVVFPIDGIGTGYARLKEYAPKTAKFLNTALKNLMDRF